MFRNESEFVTFCTGELRRTFGRCQIIVKNHGDQYQVAGRPDLEGSIFGRHIVIEAKCYPNRFEDTQKGYLKKANIAGSIAGGLVYRDDTIYWLNTEQCVNFSWRNINQWRKIGSSKEVDFLFLYKYLTWYFMFYTGDLDIDQESK